MSQARVDISEKFLFLTGWILVGIGIFCNEWTLEKLLSSDGILSSSTRFKILFFNIITISSGLVLLKSKKDISFTETLQKVLKSSAIILILCIFFKSITDIDPYFDTWAYHLPLAAKIWGIVQNESFTGSFIEKLFTGFPLLAEFLQGLFWFVFQRPEVANLVSFLSLAGFLYFLRIYCQIPVYLSILALLSVPLVHIHISTCYVDLPGNIFASILILMFYLLYTNNISLSKYNIFLVVVSSICAANIKYFLVPIVSLFLFFIFIIFLKNYISNSNNTYTNYKDLIFTISLFFLAGVLIFFTPIKNIIMYGSSSLPYQLTSEYLYHDTSYYWEDISQPLRWLYSVLEIKNNLFNWSIGGGIGGRGYPGFRMGGYFAFYVVLNLLLLTYIIYRSRCRDSFSAAALMVFLSILTSVMPRSHELRYYMYWMICLISLNLYLISHLERSLFPCKLLTTKSMGFIAACVFTVVFIGTNGKYVFPNFYHFSDIIDHYVNEELLKQIHDGDKVCIVGRDIFFLYTAEFHHPLQYDVESEPFVEMCKNPKVLYAKDY